jgi:hypothetical protein
MCQPKTKEKEARVGGVVPNLLLLMDDRCCSLSLCFLFEPFGSPNQDTVTDDGSSVKRVIPNRKVFDYRTLVLPSFAPVVRVLKSKCTFLSLLLLLLLLPNVWEVNKLRKAHTYTYIHETIFEQ